MQYRKLGNNTDVSVLGFGCMRFPVLDNDPSKIDEAESIKLIKHSLNLGVNYFDTAYTYHGGNSESFLGKAIDKNTRKSIYLATKLPSWKIESKSDFYKYFNEQCEKLNTDYLDYYLIHSLNKQFWQNCLKFGIIDFMNELKSSGKVHNIGFSFHDKQDVFFGIVNAYNWDFCQVQFNYLDTEYQAGIEGIKYAKQKGIDIIIMEPLRGGALADKLPNEALELIQKHNKQYSPAQWGLKYVWNYSDVSLVLSGMNSIEQLNQNCATASETIASSLSQSDLSLINNIKQILESKIKVNCTDCKYCMPCPVGINIPFNFNIYNNANIFSDKQKYKEYYDALTAEQKAENCVKCGKCEKLCPQHIQIRNKLSETVLYFKQ